MTNYEKYKNWFDENYLVFLYGRAVFGVDIKTNKPIFCDELDCEKCKFNNGCMCENVRAKWLKEEYEDPNVDWGKVKVDTKIQVRQNTDQHWMNAYFKSYENGKVRTWPGCGDSWLNIDCTAYSEWTFARLYEE